MNFPATIVDWLDTHSGAATVLSTFVLALITALYVFITYLLVRQGRRAHFEPRLRRELSTGSEGLFRLQVRSLGPGIAAGVVLRSGPARGLPAGFAIENLGTATDLGPGEERDWQVDWHGTGVRPVISFALSYLDRDRRRIHFDVFQVRFAAGQVSTSAGFSKDFTAARLRRLALRERRWRAACVLVSPRRRSVEGLIIDATVREALGRYLDRQLRKKLEWGSTYEASMAEL